MLAALKAKDKPEVIKPGDTGDDMVLPPDPGFMGARPTITEVSGKPSQMPFPDNHDPRADFTNRWPTNLPPAGILNDLKPKIENGPALQRKMGDAASTQMVQLLKNEMGTPQNYEGLPADQQTQWGNTWSHTIPLNGQHPDELMKAYPGYEGIQNNDMLMLRPKPSTAPLVS